MEDSTIVNYENNLNTFRQILEILQDHDPLDKLPMMQMFFDRTSEIHEEMKRGTFALEKLKFEFDRLESFINICMRTCKNYFCVSLPWKIEPK
jgi:hypothetical protein